MTKRQWIGLLIAVALLSTYVIGMGQLIQHLEGL